MDGMPPAAADGTAEATTRRARLRAAAAARGVPLATILTAVAVVALTFLAGKVIYRLRDVSRPAPNLVSATVEYVVGERSWTQTFTTRRLDEDELAAALATAGLRLDRYLTPDHSWLRALPR